MVRGIRVPLTQRDPRDPRPVYPLKIREMAVGAALL